MAAREAAEAAAGEQARLQGELAAVRAQLEAAAGPPEGAAGGRGRHDAQTAALLEQLQARARHTLAGQPRLACHHTPTLLAAHCLQHGPASLSLSYPGQ